MNIFFKTHMPQDKKTWIKFFKIFLPIIMGSTLFALNGVVDNFMVGHVEQGQTALGAINSWTSIVNGILVGISAIGSILIGQFYYSKKYKAVKEIIRFRYLLSFILITPISAFAWIAPNYMTKLFYSSSSEADGYNLVMKNARDYASIIAIQWLLICISFNLGSQLREIGYGKHTMIYGIGSLSTNILFNSIFMYVINMGVKGAAIASCMGRIFAIIYSLIIIKSKDLKISFNPFTILKTSTQIKKLFFKRILYFIALSTVYIFIQLRNTFFSMAYQGGEYNLGNGVSGLSIVALAGAISSVFFTAMSALSAMAAIFVGSELGKNNLKQAKINSNQLKGFNTIIAIFLSLILFSFSFLIQKLSFFSENHYDKIGNLTFDGENHLLNVRNCLIVLAIFYPTWVWFSTSYRNGNAGGKGTYFILIHWIVNCFQVGWAAIVMLVMVRNFEIMQNNFWLSYAIFFSFDLLKLILIEIYYYKSEAWLHSITKTEFKKECGSYNKIS